MGGGGDGIVSCVQRNCGVVDVSGKGEDMEQNSELPEGELATWADGDVGADVDAVA